MPHDQGAVRLDHLEGMGTGALDGHGEERESSSSSSDGLAAPAQAGKQAAGRKKVDRERRVAATLWMRLEARGRRGDQEVV